jgi:hypothetical protein
MPTLLPVMTAVLPASEVPSGGGRHLVKNCDLTKIDVDEVDRGFKDIDAIVGDQDGTNVL